MLAERMKSVKPSPTLVVSARAAELARQGVDVVNFSVGEPDFPTPQAIKQAGIRAIEQDFTRYTASSGIPDLRRAICDKLRRDNGLDYSPDEVIVSSGAKQCLFNLALAMFAPGDEVILPAPCWVSYEPQVALPGAAPVLIEARRENGFRVTPEQLRGALSPRTKALILNSPSNPTGAAYTREQLAGLAAVLEPTRVFVVADEIYEKIVYDGFVFTSFAALGPQWKDRCLVVNGVSKSYAMTGWRIGYAAGPRAVIGAMGKIQDHSTSNANSIAQLAALEAIRGPQEEVEAMRRAFQERRDLMLDWMGRIPGVACPRPQGAFYLFADWRAYLGRRAGGAAVASCIDLANYLLDEARVAVVPGAGFCAPGHLRFSYATSPERIAEGMRRVLEAAERLD
ncbi:MAG: pyridoxal phosphate-dependent aminotransferase [Candidatus Eisenbacteria bacterium]|uniref:Aminotransferase n=1 Tax=Eiseniibacteriota bacterium TaxID=2212470 RepID=A0A937X841_UNCEI|nr:pyridoxal phosphate-dependent aminotransferase [Candidatus Eisenbacteria bacterium]